jgi:hypothetical protein
MLIESSHHHVLLGNAATGEGELIQGLSQHS